MIALCEKKQTAESYEIQYTSTAMGNQLSVAMVD